MDICLKTFDGLRASESLHPLHAGDLLYTQILSTISDADLPVTLSILGSTILYGQEQLTTLILANFLSLNQETFYWTLRRVHSVMEVPPAPEAPRLCLLLYRSSFADYLSDPVRSGRFAIDEGTVHLKVARQGFQWLRHASRTKPDPLLLPEPSWIPDKISRENIIHALKGYSISHCWRACHRISDNLVATLLKDLEEFDFYLEYETWDRWLVHDFAYFVRWLHSLDNTGSTLVSVENIDPLCPHELCHCDATKDFLAPFNQASNRFINQGVHVRLGKSHQVHFNLRVNPELVSRSKIGR
ncbi:hypothetical protein AN958_08111 [Leucoagaricus sp. SymC.cos]|nr:hypothetical protein AN958_08111 [Leucoagaricus sp. SymC.cos]